jgi:formate-dependent nitrite reductase cytochrome c552 subunit
MKIKLPNSSQNWMTIIGVTLALISFFMIVFLFVITSFFNQGGSYLGLIIYIVLPIFLVIGLVLIPVGMFLKYRKEKKLKKEKLSLWPILDFNDSKKRNAFVIFSIGSAIFLLASSIGSYEAFHFTESVEFCGTICHKVMNPEYTAYQNSAHARVACVECHVGTGADWYVRSKMAGLYQVYSVLFNKYSKPIETPIKNLRPARETCERCHWPEKFYARKLVNQRHFLTDDANTEWNIFLIMKVGSSHSALGLKEGIHWHINPNIRIEYVAADNKNEQIPWVRYTNINTGESHIYEDSNNPPSDSLLRSKKTQTMDCMDCHNRPSHSYNHPSVFLNNALTSGEIDKSLPGIKSLAMDLLNKQFSTKDSTLEYISTQIIGFYKEKYPDIYVSKQESIKRSIQGIQNGFAKNVFPEMNVRWAKYPNHIGHMHFNGCFRCHNDSHTSKDNKTIPKDCNLCHTIVSQGPVNNLQVSTIDKMLEFLHPGDVGDIWKSSLCIDCHSGTE